MKKTKVLFVEDEQSLGLIVKESLETRDFDVRYCQDGKAGLQAFHEFNPDICLLDIMMPEKDGFTLAQEIRRTDSITPIIFLTARSQTVDVVKGFEIGGNDYIKKPFSIEELIVRIKARLTEPTVTMKMDDDNFLFQIGNYQFDHKKQTLQLRGQTTKLTHREAEILKLLCINKNQVVERALVLKKVWGDDNFFNARSMDVFITKLRKHLQGDPNVEIMNVRGIGYKMIY
ncbi:MAG: response regulator transcription factor [Bacteroidales bacterium]|nr:response regulator transcription factor [Bacteroidales bacterium]MDD3385699.1 response regulator transcription factor [Bacteroidales bacterium]